MSFLALNQKLLLQYFTNIQYTKLNTFILISILKVLTEEFVHIYFAWFMQHWKKNFFSGF